MTPAQQAISRLNSCRLLVEQNEMRALATILSMAAVHNDTDAIQFLWLLNWKPQQRVN